MKEFKLVSTILIALALGVFGLALGFSDLSPGESWADRFLVGTVFFLIGGAAIGFLNKDYWQVSALLGWGGVMLGLLFIPHAFKEHGTAVFSAPNPPYVSYGITMLIGPPVIAFVGG
ncbi:MAG: hypothetical protein LC730_02135, partial [Acidobacteria bacterium]|nr:hypothetical protein [Acidobacteriota bacterium]